MLFHSTNGATMDKYLQLTCIESPKTLGIVGLADTPILIEQQTSGHFKVTRANGELFLFQLLY